MIEIEIGGYLLTAALAGCFTVLAIQWWKYRYLGRRG